MDKIPQQVLLFQSAVNITRVLLAIPLDKVINPLFVCCCGCSCKFFKEQVQCFSQCIGLFIGRRRRFRSVCTHREAQRPTGTKKRHDLGLALKKERCGFEKKILLKADSSFESSSVLKSWEKNYCQTIQNLQTIFWDSFLGWVYFVLVIFVTYYKDRKEFQEI